METRRCVVHGRVQGVGFRWFVTRNAEVLGVRGTVRNRGDGTVEAVLQADDPGPVEALLERIRRGPAAARVDTVDSESLGAEPRYAGFEVVR